jgi:hypothetical protein
LGYLDGKIFRQTAERHTHAEWLAFIQHLEKQTPAGLTLHLIIDNDATHRHPKVKSWIRGVISVITSNTEWIAWSCTSRPLPRPG